MEEEKLKKREKDLRMLAAEVAVVALAVVGLVLGLAWFASNQKVSAGGMVIGAASVNISARYSLEEGDTRTYQTLEKDTEIDMSALKRPGDSVTIYVRFKNEDNESHPVTEFGLSMGQENGFTRNDTGDTVYFLGSQIEARLEAAAFDGDTDRLLSGTWERTGKRLAAEDGTAEDTILYFAGEETVEFAPAGKSGSEIEFKIVLTFVETEVNQDVYKNFGDAPVNAGQNNEEEACTRNLYLRVG